MATGEAKPDREGTFEELDAIKHLCSLLGLSCLMIDPGHGDGVEPLIGNRETIELLVSRFAGEGWWMMIEGEVNLEREYVPLASLPQH